MDWKAILAILVLLHLIISPASALISDKLSVTNSPDANAKIKAEEYAKIIAAKETTVIKDTLSFKYNIKKISYDSKRGTVDIWCNLYIDGKEKAVRNPIHIANPPTYHVSAISIDSKTGEVIQTRTEDPDAVIREILYQHALTLKDGKAENDDTLIAYATEDAYISHFEGSAAYATLRGGAGTTIDRTGTSGYVWLRSTDGAGFERLGRFGFVFPTGGLHSNSSTSIDAATLHAYIISKANALGSPSYNITAFAPADFNTLVIGDYDSFVNTDLATGIPYASVSTSTYNTWTLNAAGLAAINTSADGKTPIMARDSWDIANAFGGALAVAVSDIRIQALDNAGTDKDPYMTITYSTGGAPIAPVAAFGNTTGFPVSGQLPHDEQWTARFTDSSTNTPTTWNWSFGDGNMTNSTQQNPIHTYLKAGSFHVNLSACNVAGCDSENKTSYVNILPKNVTVKDFVGYPALNGTRPLPVGFVFNMSNGSTVINTMKWHFGDSNTSTDWNPAHTYSPVGEFDVSLDLVNTTLGNFTVSKSKYINVTYPSGLTGNFVGYPALNGTRPLSVAFVANTTGALVDSWYWQFGDYNTSTQQNPVYTYYVPGTHTVTLIAVNSSIGNTTFTKTNYITVNGFGSITADFVGYPALNGTRPLNVAFVLNYTGNLADGYYWQFGDSNTSTSQNPVHLFEPWGQFTVSVIIENSTIGNTTVTKTNYINATLPAPPAPPAYEASFDWDWCDKQDMFFCWTASDIAGYRGWTNLPELSVQRFVSVDVDNTVARRIIGCWTTPAGLPGVTSIAPGLWRFRTYHNVSSAVGNSFVQFEIYNRSLDGTETRLWYGDALTKEINTLTTEEYLTSYARRNWTVLFSGDRLVMKAYACTTGVASRTVSMSLAGNTNTSMVDGGWFICEDDNQVAATVNITDDDTPAMGLAAIIGGLAGGLLVVARKRRDDRDT